MIDIRSPAKTASDVRDQPRGDVEHLVPVMALRLSSYAGTVTFAIVAIGTSRPRRRRFRRVLCTHGLFGSAYRQRARYRQIFAGRQDEASAGFFAASQFFSKVPHSSGL
jgi:hypothetical protein